MDPNQTLRDFWTHYAAYREARSDCDSGDAAIDAAETAAHLFEWLAKGGFAPVWTEGE